MKFNINGAVMQTLELELNKNEVVYSQTSSMCWMSDKIRMNTHTGGGLMAGLVRSLSGGGLFITDFTALEDAHLAFAPRFPGSIIAKKLAAGESIICRKETFLCAEKSVSFEMAWQKRFGAGLFGGEGFILQRVTEFGRGAITGAVETVD